MTLSRLCMVGVAASHLAVAGLAAEPSSAAFQEPPHSAKPRTWWHWMNGHVSREGITRDLEAKKQAGIAGFTLFNASEGTPPGPVPYMSEAWWDLIRHTLAEAERLGLEMGVHNCAGWSSSGGPWITPDRAMQEVVWTELRVTGPMEFDGVLEIPEPALGIERDMRRDPEINKRYYVPREQVQGYYRDIALLAFPTLKGDQAGKPWRIENWRPKAAFSKLRGDYVADARRAAPEDCIDPGGMLELTSRLDIEGRLRWQVPPGDWTLLRMGYQPTGRQNHPAPVAGRGLEVDKLSAAALDFHWRNSIAKLIQVAGDKAGRTFNHVLIDSFEVGHQNWSVSLAQDFRHLRGYELGMYLPALTGRVVGDVERTERFLWDFRKTISDLIARNYYGRFAELCRQSGLAFACEAYGHFGNMDDFVAVGIPDIPMAEWWTFRETPYHTATAKLAASAAHTYGRRIVGAEAFTGPPDRIFEEHPNSLKAQGDFFFCQGVNQFSLHAFVHNPYERLPGLGLGTYGSRFDRRNTWWPYAGAWLEYVARSQYLLQEGRFVADLLYYAGEDAPQESKVREKLMPAPPAGYDYDFCNREVLERLEVREGRLVLPGGMSYRLLVLPPARHMRWEVLRKIEALVAAGAVVVGARPERTPGLEGGGEVEQRLRELAERMWGDCDGEAVTMHRYGQGRVYWGRSLESVCGELGLEPDASFRVVAGGPFGATQYPGEGVEYIHRRSEQADWYFVSNQHGREKTIQARFRIAGRVPEVWMPDRGTIHRLPDVRSDGEHTEVQLRFDPHEAYFVVFRDAARSTAKTPAPWLRSRKVMTDLSGGWSVEFQTSERVRLEMPGLVSWSELEQEDARYHSGTATYRRTFEVPKSEIGNQKSEMHLDLGEVQVMARVVVNGEDCGIAWKTPYRVNVTGALKPGVNTLEITVANLWVNRILGDQRYPDDCQWTTNTGSTAKGLGLETVPDWVINNTSRPSPQRKTFVGWRWPHLTADKELLPSGLLGPVRLVRAVEGSAE